MASTAQRDLMHLQIAMVDLLAQMKLRYSQQIGVLQDTTAHLESIQTQWLIYVTRAITVLKPVRVKFSAELESTLTVRVPKKKLIVSIVHLVNTAPQVVLQLHKVNVTKDIIARVVMIRSNLVQVNVLQDNSAKQAQLLPRLVNLELTRTQLYSLHVSCVLKVTTAREAINNSHAQKVISAPQ